MICISPVELCNLNGSKRFYKEQNLLTYHTKTMIIMINSTADCWEGARKGLSVMKMMASTWIRKRLQYSRGVAFSVSHKQWQDLSLISWNNVASQQCHAWRIRQASSHSRQMKTFQNLECFSKKLTESSHTTACSEFNHTLPFQFRWWKSPLPTILFLHNEVPFSLLKKEWLSLCWKPSAINRGC